MYGPIRPYAYTTHPSWSLRLYIRTAITGLCIHQCVSLLTFTFPDVQRNAYVRLCIAMCSHVQSCASHTTLYTLSCNLSYIPTNIQPVSSLALFPLISPRCIHIRMALLAPYTHQCAHMYGPSWPYAHTSSATTRHAQHHLIMHP